MISFKSIIIGLISLLLNLGGCLDLNKCAPPEKPEGTPSSCFWVGGCDGGDWVKVLSFEQEEGTMILTCEVYNEEEGLLEFKNTYIAKNISIRIQNKLKGKGLSEVSNYVTEESYVLTLLDDDGNYVILEKE